MYAKKSAAIAAQAIALLTMLLCAWPATAQDSKTPYPAMAPVEQYLIADQASEIALARSAAPDSISRDAEVMVLGHHGYETAVEGKNGFVCIVERSWTAPLTTRISGTRSFVVHSVSMRQPRAPTFPAPLRRPS